MEDDLDITEPPLSAGSMASLHLGSFALEYRFTSKYFKSIHDDFKKLEARVPSKRGLKSLRDAAHVFSLRSHEQDHLNRLVGTSFGYLLDATRSRWVMATAKLVGERMEGANPSLPLGAIAPSLKESTNAIIADLESRSSERSQHLICQGLSDCLHALMDDVPGPRLVSALWGLTAGNPDKIRYLLDNAGTPCRSGFSAVTPPEEQHRPFMARHLLELFGWREQGNALLALGYDLKEVEELFTTESNEYQLAFEIWRRIIPHANDSIELDGDTEQVLWGKSFPFELFVCADLALWPPFEPPGRLRPGFRWYDINPAKRFVSILVAFRELGLPLETTRDDDLNGRLLELQAQLCGRLNWPTPDSLAREWFDFLTAEQTKKVTPWHELEPELSLRVDGGVALLRTRIERPADVVLNHLSVDEYGGRSAPLWIFELPQGKKQFSSLAEPFHDYLLQALLHEGTAHLYKKNRAIIDALESPWLRETTAVYLAKQYARLCDCSVEQHERMQSAFLSFFRE